MSRCAPTLRTKSALSQHEVSTTPMLASENGAASNINNEERRSVCISIAYVGMCVLLTSVLGEVGRSIYPVTEAENEVFKGAEYRCHMWRLRQRESLALIALGHLALPVCPCDRAGLEKYVR